MVRKWSLKQKLRESKWGSFDSSFDFLIFVFQQGKCAKIGTVSKCPQGMELLPNPQGEGYTTNTYIKFYDFDFLSLMLRQ